MKSVKLNGVDASIRDMFLGIDSLLAEGDLNRYEMTALPQNQLSALGTNMFATVDFGPTFPVGEGLVLEFQYDQNEKTEKAGVDRTPQKLSETFYLRPPYWSQSIKKMGDHTLTVNVYRKYKLAGIITRVQLIGTTQIPYTVVPPAQVTD
jgi:hypothetical protein